MMRIIPQGKPTFLFANDVDSGRGPNQSVSRGMNRAEFIQVVFRAQNSTARSFRITYNRFKYQLMRFQKLQEEDSMAQVPWALGPWGWCWARVDLLPFVKVWRAWDSDCSGYLFLRRFHPEAHEVPRVTGTGGESQVEPVWAVR